MSTQAVCEKCGGTGWIIVERASVSGAERCACLSEGRAERLEERSQIPPLYRNASFENFKTEGVQELKSVMSAVKNYADTFPVGPNPGLLLIGETGYRQDAPGGRRPARIIAKGFEGLFCDYQTLLDRIRAGYDPAPIPPTARPTAWRWTAKCCCSTIWARTASPIGWKIPSPPSSPTAAITGSR